jgi:outer membrane protein assembly factor BamD
MEQEDYAGAGANFRLLESLYPGDANTLQGQVELIYAYYKQGETASVLVNAERFILEQPAHPNLDYVHYLRGLAMYNKAMETLAPVSVEIRPRPPTADLALEYFDILLQRFPASKYAEDARNRIVHLQNALAAFELATAKIYLNRGDYINAGLHARAALENYPDASVKTEAATVANMAYRMLDLQPPPPLPPGVTAAADTPRPDIGVAVPSAATAPRPEAELTAAQAAPAEPAPAASSAAPAPAAAADTAALREDWIAQQDPGAYTLQLLSVSDQEALLAFVQAHPLGELAYFETRREGYPWFSLIHGVYVDAAAARAAAAALPAGLHLPQPWIRRLGEIQAVIEAQGAQDAPQ